MNYTLKNYTEALDTQVIHMDQAVCYNPEFRATKSMLDYPSRKLQLSRAVYKNELEPSEYIANLLNQSLLSRQGERWQNFGECPEDCTDAMILSRALMNEKGFNKEIIDTFKETLKANDGFINAFNPAELSAWKRQLLISEKSNVFLMLDDATLSLAEGNSRNFTDFFKEKNFAFNPYVKATYSGFEYFAYGLIEEGYEYFSNLVKELDEKGIDTIVTLSGQTQYVWDVFLKKLDIKHPFKIINILDMVDELKSEEVLYLYAGSFYTRYLRKEEQINGLVKNNEETYIKNSIEFIPLLDADKRINRVTIWQKPVCAEFKLYGFDDKVLEKITNEGIEDIKKGIQTRTVVFDPYAYSTLKEKMGASVLHFSELL